MAHHDSTARFGGLPRSGAGCWRSALEADANVPDDGGGVERTEQCASYHGIASASPAATSCVG
jgi:hypothetical protein